MVAADITRVGVESKPDSTSGSGSVDFGTPQVPVALPVTVTVTNWPMTEVVSGPWERATFVGKTVAEARSLLNAVEATRVHLWTAHVNRERVALADEPVAQLRAGDALEFQDP